MTIQAVYDRYRLMPNLQEHQYRVAGVAEVVCQHLEFGTQIDTDNVIKACLLHDMGNIIKFDLTKFPDFLEPEGLGYWQRVQAEFKEKYGEEEHEATMLICHELHVSDRVLELVEAIGFSTLRQNYESGDLAKMICEYADCRVTPFGVVSLEERLNDLEKRYAPLYPGEVQARQRAEFRDFARKSEAAIFERVKISPEAITTQVVEEVIPSLKSIDI